MRVESARYTISDVSFSSGDAGHFTLQTRQGPKFYMFFIHNIFPVDPEDLDMHVERDICAHVLFLQWLRQNNPNYAHIQRIEEFIK